MRDTPVRLYLDNRYVKAISALQAQHAQAWVLCRTSSCPFSTLGAIAAVNLLTAR